jgi:hypothetical protein
MIHNDWRQLPLRTFGQQAAAWKIEKHPSASEGSPPSHRLVKGGGPVSPWWAGPRFLNAAVVFQNYPIAILLALEGLSIETMLDQAHYILKVARISVWASAVVRFIGEHRMATIMLRSAQDRAKVLDLLAKTGLKVKTGAAGFCARVSH